MYCSLLPTHYFTVLHTLHQAQKKSFKQLILGKSCGGYGEAEPVQQLPIVDETKEAEATSDDVKEIGKSDLIDSSSPDMNMANREKKKRMKKRRQQRKNIDENADSSSLSSNSAEVKVKSSAEVKSSSASNATEVTEVISSSVAVPVVVKIETH
jgi:hypothetical protein